MSEDQQPDLKTSTNNQPLKLIVVGVGASAGGLEAPSITFFQICLYRQWYGALVVAQHLSPSYKSMMTELLEKRNRQFLW
ncbi:hypothetical protein PEC18_00750 [Paucibacter sp. O1-1]|nr:hypothetical protein [Paucibacter sp. O1-1]MDA3824434.1 hypothetical protein [Paucibacter sp. O1-1]